MGAGKFFPGGNRRSKPPEEPSAPEPIRAEEPAPKRSGGLFPGAKSRFAKPIDSKNKPGVVLISIAFCVLFISIGWYYLAVRPAKLQAQSYAAQLAQRDKELSELKKKQEEAQKQLEKKADAKAVVKVDVRPANATVTLGSVTKKTPATFDNLPAGKATLTITLDGYHAVTRDLTFEPGQTYDLGIIELTPRIGSLKLTTALQGVTYTLTGPRNFSQSGTLPAAFDKLPEGAYTLNVTHNNWQLAPQTITVVDAKDTEQEIKFGYGTITFTTTPPGANVLRNRQVIGQTPLTLAQQRPGNYKYSLEKEGFRMARAEIDLKEFETHPVTLTLEKTPDFTNATAMSMVWMNDGYWVGKYEVTQSQFEQVMGRGSNASVFRGANRPVENVTWQQATDFCNRLTEIEQAAGKLPSGYRYALPTEAQWNVFVGDSNYDTAILALDSTVPPASTADVGSSDPNQYGLYDVLGNVWEWCQDNFDPQGRARVMRGGGWLSSRETFPNKNTRNGGGVNYRDKFTGFRVVLLKAQG